MCFMFEQPRAKEEFNTRILFLVRDTREMTLLEKLKTYFKINSWNEDSVIYLKKEDFKRI